MVGYTDLHVLNKSKLEKRNLKHRYGHMVQKATFWIMITGQTTFFYL